MNEKSSQNLAEKGKKNCTKNRSWALYSSFESSQNLVVEHSNFQQKLALLQITLLCIENKRLFLEFTQKFVTLKLAYFGLYFFYHPNSTHAFGKVKNRKKSKNHR